ncbi:MAG: lipopolysaccharide kinase InaA family protein [Kiritimatiellia bacterium]
MGDVVTAVDSGEARVQVGAYRGFLRGVARDARAREWLSRLGRHLRDQVGMVLTEGRHCNVRFAMPTDEGTVDVVVKSFACGGTVENIRSRQRGTKASCSWAAALHLYQHGVGTPEPLAWLEHDQDGRVRESYYVSVYLPDTISFKDALIGLYREEPDGTKLMALLQTVADAIRKMHASGFVHYDLGNQNILMRRKCSHIWGDVHFIDLNRGRIRAAVSDRERGRDLSRIALPSDFMRVFREMYVGGEPSRAFLTWEARYRGLYALHTSTRRLRHPVRELRKQTRSDTALEYPAPASIWIWDPLSRQPLVTMQRKERKKHFSLLRHAHVVWSSLRALPLSIYHYRAYLRDAFRSPRTFDGCVGVAVEWRADDTGRTLQALGALGPIPVLVRFYRHESKAAIAGAIELVRALHTQGHPVSVALLQDRAAVSNPLLWRFFVDEVLGAVCDVVELVEVGHAINRVKWGIWTFKEYRLLMRPIVSWRNTLPHVRFGGPAAIDFEYPYIPAALDVLPSDMRFGVLTHHLYVDRRGAPENPQGRFALVEKLALARAIGKAHKNCGDGLIVTEFNWPLAGTGIHSPVGAPYVSPGVRHNDPSVPEEEAAAYLLRYILIAIGSGLAERVFWWGLVAHGFGLIDDAGESWRERPAYLVLQAFLVRTKGLVFHRRTALQGEGGLVWCYAFNDASACHILSVLYTESPHDVQLAVSGVSSLLNAYGDTLPIESQHIRVGAMPIYVLM